MTALPPKQTHNFFPLRFSPPLPKNEEERRKMIERAAYQRAETRSFAAGHEAEDWLAAEAEIDQLIAREKVMVGTGSW